MKQLTPNRCLKTTNIFEVTGNIIPHSWYSQITTYSGKPDHSAISIFSEIVYWYRPNREGRSKFQGETWQTSYEHFETRFFYNKQRIRRGLVRLEELGLIRRELRTIEKFGQKYSNVLFIKLLAIPGENAVVSNTSHNSSNIRPEISSGKLLISSVSSLDDQTVSYNNEQSSCLEETSLQSTEKNKKIYLPISKFDTPSLQICREHYIDIENKLENKEKDLIRREDASSIFSFSKLEEGRDADNNEQSVYLNKILNSESKKNKQNLKTEYNSEIFSEMSDKTKKLFGILGNKNLKPKILDWEEGRVLSQLSDISEEEKDNLNKRAGREFSLNFINQLVLKLGVKCPENRFFRREQFLNYMVKALSNEILQAPQANNEDFKFACLLKTEEEIYQNKINKYLEDIESSINTSLDMRLKKKILGRLEPRLAYEIISGTSLSVVLDKTCDTNHIETENEEVEELHVIQKIQELQGLQEQEMSQELQVKILRPLKLNSAVNGSDSATEIPEWMKHILLEEARGIYGKSVHNCSIFSDVKFISNTNKASTKRSYANFEINTSKTPELNYDSESEYCLDKAENTNSVSVKDQVLKRLKEIYGLATYKSWFSKLDILDTDINLDTIEAKTKTEVRIQTQTGFLRDWIRINYGSVIEQVLKSFCPNLQYVEFI